MARARNKLTARAVEAWAKAHKCGKTRKKLGDGGKLYLKAGANRCGWVFLFTWHGKPDSISLGPYPQVGLAEARRERDKNEELQRQGINPREAKKKPRGCSFGEAAEACFAAKSPEWRSAKHRSQWRSTLETYCGFIWQMPIEKVDTPEVLGCLQPIWLSKSETASRLRGRIEAVRDFAKAHGWCNGENPARSAWCCTARTILPPSSPACWTMAPWHSAGSATGCPMK